MKIGELSARTGVANHTIRFYEANGLLPKASRNNNGYRYYNKDSIQRLETIQFAKRLGMSLESIATIFANRQIDDALDHDQILQQLDNRLNEVNTLLQVLNQQRDDIIKFKQQLKKSWQQGECLHIYP